MLACSQRLDVVHGDHPVADRQLSEFVTTADVYAMVLSNLVSEPGEFVVDLLWRHRYACHAQLLGDLG